ncbi:MAG: hypothetical protein HQL68_02200, partial [Magnetococcales bacterium]|nr:hypothetical protein [Magnetococcales bacterium]
RLLAFGGGLKALPRTIFGIGKAFVTTGWAIAASPLGLAIAGVAAAGILIYKFWQPLKAFFGGIWEGFTSAIGPVIDSWQPLFDVLKPIGSLLGWIGDKIGSVISWFGDLLSPVTVAGETLEGFVSAGEMVGKVIGGAFELLLLPITGVAKAIGWVGDAYNSLFGDKKEADISVAKTDQVQKTEKQQEKAPQKKSTSWVGNAWNSIFGDDDEKEKPSVAKKPEGLLKPVTAALAASVVATTPMMAASQPTVTPKSPPAISQAAQPAKMVRPIVGQALEENNRVGQSSVVKQPTAKQEPVTPKFTPAKSASLESIYVAGYNSKIDELVKSLKPSTGPSTSTVANTYGDIIIHAAPGQDAEDIAKKVMAKIKQQQAQDKRGALHD